MRKVLVSIAALGAALAAGPSLAQSYGYPGGGNGQPGYGDNRFAVPSPWQVRDMVERAIQRGDVSRGEARGLRDDVRELFRLQQRTRYGNDWRAQRELQHRTMEVLRTLRESRRDGNGRWDRRDDDYRDR